MVARCRLSPAGASEGALALSGGDALGTRASPRLCGAPTARLATIELGCSRRRVCVCEWIMTPLPKLAVFDLGEEQQAEFRAALPFSAPGGG